MEQVERLIDNAKWRKDKKTEVYRLLQLIAQEGSLPVAEEAYYNGTTIKEAGQLVKGSRRSFYDYLASCKAENINPVTIPTEWGIAFLKSNMVKNENLLFEIFHHI